MYTSFSSGQLDHGLPIPEEYQDSTVVVKVGKSRSDLIIVSIECSVAEVVSNLGQYMDFAVGMGMGIQGAVQDQSTAFFVLPKKKISRSKLSATLSVKHAMLVESALQREELGSSNRRTNFQTSPPPIFLSL